MTFLGALKDGVNKAGWAIRRAISFGYLVGSVDGSERGSRLGDDDDEDEDEDEEDGVCRYVSRSNGLEFELDPDPELVVDLFDAESLGIRKGYAPLIDPPSRSSLLPTSDAPRCDSPATRTLSGLTSQPLLSSTWYPTSVRFLSLLIAWTLSLIDSAFRRVRLRSGELEVYWFRAYLQIWNSLNGVRVVILGGESRVDRFEGGGG